MSQTAQWEYLRAIYMRYRWASRPLKQRILDEFYAVSGSHRKHALRLLHGPPPERSRPRRRQRATTYGRPVIRALADI